MAIVNRNNSAKKGHLILLHVCIHIVTNNFVRKIFVCIGRRNNISARCDSIFPLLRCQGVWKKKPCSQLSLSQILFQNPKNYSLGDVQRFCYHSCWDSTDIFWPNQQQQQCLPHFESILDGHLSRQYHIFPGGKERPGRDADPSPPSSAVGHERVELYLYSPLWAVRPVQSLSACTRVHFTFTFTVELYLYSPYGQYGLYRASVPVQGCTLPYSRAIPLLPLMGRTASTEPQCVYKGALTSLVILYQLPSVSKSRVPPKNV